MRPIVRLLAIWVVSTGTVIAAEAVEPGLPDLDYCSRRDADPRKCVIQDGPPPRPIVRQKPEQPPVVPPVPEKPAEKSPGLKGR
jgi:hypothetical protein